MTAHKQGGCLAKTLKRASAWEAAHDTQVLSFHFSIISFHSFSAYLSGLYAMIVCIEDNAKSWCGGGNELK